MFEAKLHQVFRMADGSFADSTFASALAFSLEKLGLSSVSLKEEQRAAIKAVYEGTDVFVCLPTGYGKSLCYQTLPFVMDYKHRVEGIQQARASAVLVVSFDNSHGRSSTGLRKQGVQASIITSSSSVAKENFATDDTLATESLFFCAPEALVMSRWRDAFERPEFSDRIVAVIIDEAHCISKW